MQESRTKFERLGQNDQKNVESLRQSIFGRWPTPAVPAEAKADWDDDIAVLFVDYGYAVLDQSIKWHRQNSDRRPTIAGIREQCKSIRETAGRRMSSSDLEHNAYLADVQRHVSNPDNDEFTPYALIVRDALELQQLKAKARGQNYTPKPGELEQWKAWRADKTRIEWREMRRAGVVQLREKGRDPNAKGELDSATKINLDYLHAR
jgi:hypothetical protein